MKSSYLYSGLYRIVTNPAIIAVIIFSLLLIASSGEYMVNDEAIWNYIAFLWIKYGVPPYVGGIENKTPGIFMIFAVSNLLFDLNIWFPRVLGSLSLVATSIVLYLMGRKLYDHLAGILAMIFFGLSVTWKFVDGTYTAQTESFMVLFSTLAFFFILKTQGAKTLSSYLVGIFTAGFFMGVAIVFKQTAVFSAIALFAFLLSLDDKYSSTYKNTLRAPFFLLAGVVFPMCLSLIPLLASGVTTAEFLNNAWLVLLQEGGGSADYKMRRIWEFITAWRYSEMLLFYPLVLLFIFQKKRMTDGEIPFWGIVFWMGLDFLGVNASGYYFGHQFKQLMPSIALASGIAISMLFQTESVEGTERRKSVVLAILIISLLWAPYQTLYRSYSINVKDADDEYGRYMQLGLWIKEHTQDDDYIYILGNHTNPAQAYSQRRSASQYFNWLFTERQGARQEIINDLNQKMPKLILINQTKSGMVGHNQTTSGMVRRIMPRLETILKKHYRYKTTQYDTDIYERTSQ